jgi:stearoyl-CoA desaturase (Delta-9 desaturase)
MTTAPAPLVARSSASPKHRYEWASTVPFILSHLAVLGAIWSGVTWEAAIVCAVLFFSRIFAVTGVYHRYFAHRTYKTSRVFQFVLAFFAQTSAQRGALWWAAHHRAHHLHSDQEKDLHSVRQKGFWHAHLMWIFDGVTETDWKRIQDFSKYPELRWLNKYWLVPPTILAVATLVFFGWPGLFIGFFLATVLNWHATYLINSLCHVWGNKRFETKDDSKNNFWLALLTFGEGWHNNHHHYMNSARQGFYWWEIDITYYILKVMSWVGLVWDLKEPPARILEDGRRRDRERKLARNAAA